MGREQSEIIGQRENLLVHVLVQQPGVALLEIGAATAAD